VKTLKQALEKEIRITSTRRYEVLELIKEHNEDLKQEANALSRLYDLLNNWLFCVNRIDKDYCLNYLYKMRDKYWSYIQDKSYLLNFNIEMYVSTNRIIRGIENV